jgi:hypothetical protein
MIIVVLRDLRESFAAFAVKSFLPQSSQRKSAKVAKPVWEMGTVPLSFVSRSHHE